MTPPDNHTHDFTSHPFVIARHWNETAVPLEGIAEHRLVRNRFGACIERRQPHFLERLAPPVRNEIPPHRYEHALLERRDDRVNVRCRADVIARLKIGCRRREVIEPLDFGPGVMLSESPAHAAKIGFQTAFL